jgi:enoyl-CoA hydratase
MSSELVAIRRHGDVLDRPDNGNKLNAAMSTAIIDAISRFDDAVKLVRIMSSSAVTLRAVRQFLHLAPEMPATAASGFAAHLAATALSARF